MNDDWLERLRDLRDRWGDHYWRANHPELTAIVIAVASGLIGLLFAYLQLRLERRYKTPRTGDV